MYAAAVICCLPVYAFKGPPWKVSTFSPANRSAVNTAFVTHHDADGVNKQQLRRLLRDLGTDVTPRTAAHLIEMYAKNGGESANLEDVQLIVDSCSVTSPTRFLWLVVDPNENGIRRVRPKWNKFANAGLHTPIRVLHYMFGLMAVTIGTVDATEYVLNLGVTHLDPVEINLHASIHLAAALFALPRFRYRRTKGKPWYLWLTSARDAAMWPSFIGLLWGNLALRSDLVMPNADYSFHSAWFQCYTYVTIGAAVYTTLRGIEERGSHQLLDNPVYNAFFLTIPITVDPLRSLLLSKDPATYESYVQIVQAHPEFYGNIAGSLLFGMYIGNVVCALASAEHYDAITKDQVANVNTFLGIVGSIVPYVAFVSIDDGALARDTVNLLVRTVGL